MSLHLDVDDLNSCVACGLCLPHCPTFRVTGEEARSPRGRIEAMRGVQFRGAPIDDEFVEFMTSCVQCRGCEPACPSNVPFGSLIEGTRAAIADRTTPRWQRWGYEVLRHHRLLTAGSTLLAVAQRLRLVPRRLAIPEIPVRRGRPVAATAAAGTADAWLFTGCVMDAWMRATHRSTARILDALEATYALPGPGGACCGALHLHAGLHARTSEMAAEVIASMPGDAPIVVNSAGCGAALKDYGTLLGTDAARAFSARVMDVHEWLAPRIGELDLRRGDPVIVQDPCHLRHVQRAHEHVRTVLGGVGDVVELDDQGLCCGAGGAYSALQPELAGDIRDRKVAAIRRAATRSGAKVVASANPGCLMHLEPWLGAHGIAIAHPIDLVAATLR